ncbi:hypothetical protein [Xanthomonas translucens]|nr:hypothetical protein [Xanthomonas translucens]QEN93614.1 hypothetical protein F0H33_09695 [Xanthomonas translucens pv. undulosa]QSQ34673.1 hypothetical protein ISN31_03340 [Xanthomonas translucens pv. translucens]QSQ58072.1 hypothetical protein ISN37_09135 [Xanthomonas translucens pv. undulosa]UPU47793.1 hypothetical protein MZO50_13625 [Xanthomonas translucens pv. undulosa]WLA06520.1 hypothetical protein MO329_09720 [Xanthomonas translucens]
MSIDHGVLNVPLTKRGNIDTAIDRYKAQQQRETEAVMRGLRNARAAARTEALALIERMTDEHVSRWALRLKCQARSVRKRLRSEAGLNPTLVLRALRDGGAA